ncbi:MAG: hypothetical protein H6668_04385 [Ardenticatenaceae bacterium]|nr:hypothetical protein [Ardenticatenaceae bacterium]
MVAVDKKQPIVRRHRVARHPKRHHLPRQHVAAPLNRTAPHHRLLIIREGEIRRLSGRLHRLYPLPLVMEAKRPFFDKRPLDDISPKC